MLDGHKKKNKEREFMIIRNKYLETFKRNKHLYIF